MTVLNEVLIGSVAPLGPASAPSGIDKHGIGGRILATRFGLVGDEQGDRKNHGGPDKALHHYPFDHYSGWIADIGMREVLTRPGAFGENLSTLGMTETTVAIGDVFQLGGALLQVSQGRQPCWKLNERFGVRDMAMRVQRTGLTGWYYRVLQEGDICAGDAFILVDRISPDWTIDRARRVLYVDTMNLDELREMAALAHLPDSWRKYAMRRLETRRVEDWTRRLEGTKAFSDDP